VPHSVDGFIDRRIDFFFRKAVNFVRTAIKERFQIPCRRGPACRGRNPLRRDGSNANLFVRRNRPAEKLFNSRPHRLGQLAAF
jgi:hypothetical protein